ncbi:MAG: hypothetical protein QNJ49_11555 [Mastigocoleus sp. MO_167.B18]|nr:hypothetical protein [Mastigocoleus sp. MO_167.B18]
MNAINNTLHSADLPLYSSEDVDLEIFNSIRSPDDMQGKPVEDMKRLFHKEVIVDDETSLDTETIQVPGFIGIADEDTITNFEGKTVSGHQDIVQFLNRYGLLVCTYQYNKDRYGQAVDLRHPPQSDYDIHNLVEIFIKNEGHHSGVIVPAIRESGAKAFASFNEPDDYHKGLYGENGFVAIVQNLIFPKFVTSAQQKGYTDSIIGWMALMNPFVQFSGHNFNGGDPTRVLNKTSLKELLKNCALASVGDESAIEFLKSPENKAYCSEFVYISLNTTVYPFNLKGLSLVLDGDESKAKEILEIQKQQNRRQENILSDKSLNPQLKAFNISMPIVPSDLQPLDVLMANNGMVVDPNSIPFPPFTLSQVLRRAFRTLLPRHQDVNDTKIIEAQVKLFGYLEPLILRQLGLDNSSLSRINQESSTEIDEKVKSVREFIAFTQSILQQNYSNYAELDLIVDKIMTKADELIGADDAKYFVPPRIYVDLGQNDDDGNLPQGWGFKLNTVGALIYRGALRDISVNAPSLTPKVSPENSSQGRKS